MHPGSRPTIGPWPEPEGPVGAGPGVPSRRLVRPRVMLLGARGVRGRFVTSGLVARKETLSMLPVGRAALLLLTAATVLPAQSPPAAPATPKVKVLILTGVHGHKWRETTPVLREFLERSARFDVHVNEEVRSHAPDTSPASDLPLPHRPHS